MTRLPAGQLRPLVVLRWRMVRSAKARAGLAAAAATLPALMVMAIAVGIAIPRTVPVGEVLLITPSLLVGFLVLSITAPLAAGGGVELYPPEQLVAYPIRPRTVYGGALLLAPLNLAWLLQVLLALALITYVTSGAITGRLATALTVMIYLAFVTLLGQAVAWGVVGIRRTRIGRLATWTILAVVAATVLLLIRADRLTPLLDESPTIWVVVGALAPSSGDWSTWALRSAFLLALALACVALGIAACRWALQRPGDGGSIREDRPVRRHSMAAPTTRRLLVRLDRMSVWRAPALRRGALVLGILPAAVILVARADWNTLILLPGLVSAGAGLLFAVNAFCLDASGAVWLSSLPLADRTVFWVRAGTVAQVVGVPVLVALTAGMSRVTSPWTLTNLAAVVAAAAASVALVTAWCVSWSIRRPHRADLRGPRDTPAPPGSMAVYALKLAVATTGIGLMVSVLALIGPPLAPLLFGGLIVALAARSLERSATTFSLPGGRSRVVATVSGG